LVESENLSDILRAVNGAILSLHQDSRLGQSDRTPPRLTILSQRSARQPTIAEEVTAMVRDVSTIGGEIAEEAAKVPAVAEQQNASSHRYPVV
jgi:hypothetical protein